MHTKIKRTSTCFFLALAMIFLINSKLYAQCAIQTERRASDNNSFTSYGSVGPIRPRMAVDPTGAVFSVWYDESTTGSGIYLSKLDNDGNRLWADDIKLSVNFPLSFLSNQDVAVDQFGNVYVVWGEDYTTETITIPEITFTKLDNNGNVLIPPTRVTYMDEAITFASLVKRGVVISIEPGGSYLHLAWSDNRQSTIGPVTRRYEIYYNKLDLNGNPAFANDIRVSYRSGTYESNPESQWPAIAADGSGNAHISWDTRKILDEPSSRVFYNRIDPAGNIAFAGDIDITGGDIDNKIITRSGITVDSLGSAHIAWTGADNVTINSNIYYSKVLADGSLAVDYLQISNTSGSVSWGVGIDVDQDDNVHVGHTVYTETDPITYENKYHMYYTVLDNNGGVLTPSTQLTFLDAPMTVPDLGVDQNGEAHLIWSDGREAVALGSFKLYSIKACFVVVPDADGDIWKTSQGDCDDSNPNRYPGNTEVCDGLDNDCNGPVDEGLTQPTICGVGACAGNTGIDTCAAGVWSDTCDPLAGSSLEICNNVDDDCDGNIDESLTQVCGSGSDVGECQSGIQTCTAGVWGACVGEIGPTCDIKNNGLDEDCDGSDRTKGKPCSGDSGDGGREGKGKTCSDGADNDGDGQIDCADPDCSRNRACR